MFSEGQRASARRRPGFLGAPCQEFCHHPIFGSFDFLIPGTPGGRRKPVRSTTMVVQQFREAFVPDATAAANPGAAIDRAPNPEREAGASWNSICARYGGR